MRTKVILHTDGACKGNPGPGGYAGILQYGEQELIVAGFSPKTTNNAMELAPVLEAIRKLKRSCDILVRTDSHYVCTGISNAPKWAKNKWKLSNGGEPAHVESWKELQALSAKYNHTIRFQYIKGHSGDPYNERCDQIANEQIELHLKGD
jgi:ribonuclease HI